MSGSANQESEPAYTRTKILGNDIINVNTHEGLRKVMASGQVERIGVKPPSELSWIFKYFFPQTRFYNREYDESWFLPLRSKEDKTYLPCRHFLDSKFQPVNDMNEFGKQAAEILLTKSKSKDFDRQLSDICIKAVWSHIGDVSKIPDAPLCAVMKQVSSITDSFLPWKNIPSHFAIPKVYNYAEDTLKELGVRESLPDGAITDLAHVFFAMNINGPKLLLEIRDHPNDDLDDIFIRLGLTETSIRLVTKEGNLGGLLPESEAPVTPGTTVVVINIRKIGQEVNDSIFSFSSTPDRRCAAEQIIRAFAASTQSHVKQSLESQQ